MSQEFTPSQIQSFTKRDNLCFIIRDKVYDASPFVDEHPGGSEVLLEVAGTDATEAYDDAGHSEEADVILRDLLIGIIKPEESSGSMSLPACTEPPVDSVHHNAAGVLRPDTFQEFELQSRTALSENLPLQASYSRVDLRPSCRSTHLNRCRSSKIDDPNEITQVIRSYTPISANSQRGYFELLVKAYPQGRISQYLTTLHVEQKILVRGPKGAFQYTPNMVRHFGMIAGDTGITPMLQIINEIVRGRPGDKTEVDLIFANMTAGDILLKEVLDELASKDAGFRIHYVLNNPPEGWEGGVGFVSSQMLKRWLPEPARDINILLCGPPPMVSAMKQLVQDLGYGMARPVSKLEDPVFAF